MKEIIISLSNGEQVKLCKVWGCYNGSEECVPCIKVIDYNTNYVICVIKGKEIPENIDNDFIHLIEVEISWAENF